MLFANDAGIAPDGNLDLLDVPHSNQRGIYTHMRMSQLISSIRYSVFGLSSQIHQRHAKTYVYWEIKGVVVPIFSRHPFRFNYPKIGGRATEAL